MQQLIISPEQADAVLLLDDWQWLLKGPHSLLAITRMGDAFVQSADGGVYFLDTLEGALKPAAPDERTFRELVTSGQFSPDWFMPGMVALMETRGEILSPGECYCYRIPPIVGGGMGADNIERISVLVHFSIMGQLHRQVKDLPPGTKIQGFKLVP